jgi:hypothetical protein
MEQTPPGYYFSSSVPNTQHFVCTIGHLLLQKKKRKKYWVLKNQGKKLETLDNQLYRYSRSHVTLFFEKKKKKKKKKSY